MTGRYPGPAVRQPPPLNATDGAQFYPHQRPRNKKKKVQKNVPRNTKTQEKDHYFPPK